MKRSAAVKICSDDPNVKVIYEGVKTLWKTRACLDVLIADHLNDQCYELIVYDAAMGIEAPRVYVNSELVASKIHPDELDAKVAEKKESLTRAKTSFDHEAVTKDVMQDMMVQYVVSRIGIPDYLPVGVLSVVLLPFCEDRLNYETNQLDVIFGAKPETLSPLRVVCKRNNT